MSAVFEMNQYLVQEKFLKIFGNTFWIKDLQGNVIAYSKQKAFKLKEDILLYTDDSMTQPLLQIKARSVIDWGATYDVTDPSTGELLGSVKRKGLKSIVRDSWKLLDVNGNQYGELIEDSIAILRRFIPFIPAKYHFEIPGHPGITIHQQFNPFMRKSIVTIPPTHPMDKRMVAAIVLLNSAIEGRQG